MVNFSVVPDLAEVNTLLLYHWSILVWYLVIDNSSILEPAHAEVNTLHLYHWSISVPARAVVNTIIYYIPIIVSSQSVIRNQKNEIRFF
jgi:hypothetical protein